MSGPILGTIIDPLLPAVMNLSEVPAITVPMAESYQDLHYPTAADFPVNSAHLRYYFGDEVRPGDFNDDWILDDLDFLALARYLAESYLPGAALLQISPVKADLNGDGRVDVVDIEAMRSGH